MLLEMTPPECGVPALTTDNILFFHALDWMLWIESCRDHTLGQFSTAKLPPTSVSL